MGIHGVNAGFGLCLILAAGAAANDLALPPGTPGPNVPVSGAPIPTLGAPGTVPADGVPRPVLVPGIPAPKGARAVPVPIPGALAPPTVPVQPASSVPAQAALENVTGKISRDAGRMIFTGEDGVPYTVLENLVLEAAEANPESVSTLARFHAYRGEGYVELFGPPRDPYPNLIPEGEKFKGTAEILTGTGRPMIRILEPGPANMKTYPLLETELLEKWEDGHAKTAAPGAAPGAPPKVAAPPIGGVVTNVPAAQAPKAEDDYEEFVNTSYEYSPASQGYQIRGTICGKFTQYKGQNYFIVDTCYQVVPQTAAAPGPGPAPGRPVFRTGGGGGGGGKGKGGGGHHHGSGHKSGSGGKSGGGGKSYGGGGGGGKGYGGGHGSGGGGGGGGGGGDY